MIDRIRYMLFKAYLWLVWCDTRCLKCDDYQCPFRHQFPKQPKR